MRDVGVVSILIRLMLTISLSTFRCQCVLCVCPSFTIFVTLTLVSHSAESYVLNNNRCGHTFCARCILDWAFTSLHNVTGSWQAPIECPTCRAALPSIRSHPPREVHSFPFIPNRGINEHVKNFLDTLKDAASEKSLEQCLREGRAWCGEVDERVRAWGANGPAWKEWELRAQYAVYFLDKIADLPSDLSCADPIGLEGLKWKSSSMVGPLYSPRTFSHAKLGSRASGRPRLLRDSATDMVV